MDPTLYKARNMYLVRSRHYDVGKALGFGNGGWNGSSATIEAMKHSDMVRQILILAWS